MKMAESEQTENSNFNMDIIYKFHIINSKQIRPIGYSCSKICQVPMRRGRTHFVFAFKKQSKQLIRLNFEYVLNVWIQFQARNMQNFEVQHKTNKIPSETLFRKIFYKLKEGQKSEICRLNFENEDFLVKYFIIP